MFELNQKFAVNFLDGHHIEIQESPSVKGTCISNNLRGEFGIKSFYRDE